jgi:hypothetical protein
VTIALRRARAVGFALLASALAIVIAGTVVADGVAARPAAAAAAGLPPAQEAALEKIFRKDVKPLGLKVTRGMLQNLDTYERDPRGTHLALYVAPIDGDYTSAQYLKNFTKLTHMFVPAVFKRWPGLKSFDICQEPFADPRATPPPVTQIFLTRDALDRVGSWKTAELSELLAASPRVRSVASGYYVYFSPTVRTDPAFVDAAAEAGWTTTTTGLGY